MIVGVLQFDLLIHGAGSIKDKRRVVNSVKDRLHREHQVSVAEVGGLDRLNVARLALALVGGDGQHVGQVLDRITAKLRGLHDAELGDMRRELMHSSGGDEPGDPDASLRDDDLARELIARARESDCAGSEGTA